MDVVDASHMTDLQERNRIANMLFDKGMDDEWYANEEATHIASLGSAGKAEYAIFCLLRDIDRYNNVAVAIQTKIDNAVRVTKKLEAARAELLERDSMLGRINKTYRAASRETSIAQSLDRERKLYRGTGISKSTTPQVGVVGYSHPLTKTTDTELPGSKSSRGVDSREGSHQNKRRHTGEGFPKQSSKRHQSDSRIDTPTPMKGCASSLRSLEDSSQPHELQDIIAASTKAATPGAVTTPKATTPAVPSEQPLSFNTVDIDRELEIGFPSSPIQSNNQIDSDDEETSGTDDLGISHATLTDAYRPRARDQ